MKIIRTKPKRMCRPLRVVLLLFLAAVLVVLLHVVSALTADRTLHYVEVPVVSAKVTPALDGYTIAGVTDLHALPPDDIAAMADGIRVRGVDLLLLGGDFTRNLPFAMETLGSVPTTDGTYGVEGNHDDYEKLFAAMEQNGIHPLSNSGVHLREGLYLAGVEDLWNRAPDVAAATAGAGADDFVLLVAHNPDLAMEQDLSGVDLTLSGHTHGGQITLFGIFAPEFLRKDVTAYGQRFRSGWAKSAAGTPVYVSNGAGQLPTVPRVFAPPQIILFTLRTAN